MVDAYSPLPKIFFDKRGQVAVFKFFAFKQHPMLLHHRGQLLPSVYGAILVTHHEHRGLGWLCKVGCYMVGVFQVLYLFHHHHLSFCHHRVSSCSICHLTSCHVRSVHHRKIEILVLRLKRVFGYEVGQLVDVVWLLTHKVIDRSIFTSPQIAHYSVESNIFIVCHFAICGYFINFAANLGKKNEKAILWPHFVDRNGEKTATKRAYTLLYIYKKCKN